MNEDIVSKEKDSIRMIYSYVKKEQIGESKEEYNIE